MGFKNNFYIAASSVMLIGEDGKPDVEKMQLITYEPIHHSYVELGKRVGNAFADGKTLK